MPRVIGVNDARVERIVAETKSSDYVAGYPEAKAAWLNGEDFQVDPTECVIIVDNQGKLSYEELKLNQCGVMYGIAVVDVSIYCDVGAAWAVRHAKTPPIPFKDIAVEYPMKKTPLSDDHIYINTSHTADLLEVALRNNIPHQYVAVNDNGVAYARKSSVNGILPFEVVVCEREDNYSYTEQYGDPNGMSPRGPIIKFIWSHNNTEINENLLDGIVVTSIRDVKKLALRYYFSIRYYAGGNPLQAPIRFKVNRDVCTEDLTISVNNIGSMIYETFRIRPPTNGRFHDYEVGMFEMLELTDCVNEDIYQECVWKAGPFFVDGSSDFGFPVGDHESGSYCTNVIDMDLAWRSGKQVVVPKFAEEIAARRLINKTKITVIEQDETGKITSVKLSVPSRGFIFKRGRRHEIGDGYVIVT